MAIAVDVDERVVRLVGSLVAATIGVVSITGTGSGCSDPIPLGGFDSTEDSGPPPLSGEGGATPDANSFAPLCKATACPSPYGTCTSDAFPCETNFDADDNNCGACGVECPHGQDVRRYFGAEWLCQAGRCQMTCDGSAHVGDCNGQAADGCETDLECDPANCGACGVKCPDGLACRQGICGCPPGLVDCGENTCKVARDCKLLSADDENCGACGHACPYQDPPPYPNTWYGCVNSECGQIKCEYNYGNCNNDIEKDGCEANLHEDPNNCGMCGKACSAGQKCVGGKCRCAPNETECPQPWGDPICVDLDSHAYHCGVCDRVCPQPADESAWAVCRLGHCELECPRGYADCDGRVDNGCETMVSADPRNCGGCGVQCDIAFGQPCVNGACLLGPCGPQGSAQ